MTAIKPTPQRVFVGTVAFSLLFVGAALAIPGIAIIAAGAVLAERADMTFRVKS